MECWRIGTKKFLVIYLLGKKAYSVYRKRPETYGHGLIKLERKIRKNLEEILFQEEVYMFQRSREDWVVSRDRNTKLYLYHASASVRKARKRTHQLRTRKET